MLKKSLLLIPAFALLFALAGCRDRNTPPNQPAASIHPVSFAQK